MLRMEFQELLEMFYIAFGGAQYNDVQKRLLFSRIREMNKYEFKNVIESVMENATSSRLPTIGIVLNACRPYVIAAANRNKDRKIAQSIKEMGRPCEFCEHTGIVTADRVGEGKNQGIAFRCSACDAADIRRLSKSHFYPWNHGLSNRYKVRFFNKARITDYRRKLLDRCKDKSGAINPAKLLDEANREPPVVHSPEWNEWFLSRPKAQQDKIFEEKLANDEIY